MPFLSDVHIAPHADTFAVHFTENAAAPGATIFTIGDAAIEGADFAAGLIEGGFRHGRASLFAADAGHKTGPSIARLLRRVLCNSLNLLRSLLRRRRRFCQGHEGVLPLGRGGIATTYATKK